MDRLEVDVEQLGEAKSVRITFTPVPVEEEEFEVGDEGWCPGMVEFE
jgi:hypothetical protein